MSGDPPPPESADDSSQDITVPLSAARHGVRGPAAEMLRARYDEIWAQLRRLPPWIVAGLTDDAVTITFGPDWHIKGVHLSKPVGDAAATAEAEAEAEARRARKKARRFHD